MLRHPCFVINFFLFNSESVYDATSVKRVQDFVLNCRQHLESESNLFWVAVQSNQLADVSEVNDDFGKAVSDMKEELEKQKCILPNLQHNMRNQGNIASLIVEEGKQSRFKMQKSIPKLKSQSSIVGHIPIRAMVSFDNWKSKKEKVLKHCIEKMQSRNDSKNIVLLYSGSKFKDVANDVRKAIPTKTVVSYPSPEGKEQGRANVKRFIENNNHILVTEDRYFNGCEASNIIYLNILGNGVRNALLRGVENVICIQLMDSSFYAEIKGVKDDYTYYTKKDKPEDGENVDFEAIELNSSRFQTS